MALELPLPERLSLYLLEVIAHRRRGAGAALVRGFLSLAELGYRAGVALREWAYAGDEERVRRASIPVLSVGNLTAGGTGKTPFSMYLAARLAAEKRAPAVAQRGYGAERAGKLNDEGRMIERALPGVPVVADRDRLRAVERAAELGARVAVLDDGFQHRALARDLDIVLLDARAPFSNGRLLPRGLLRERPEALARAGAVVLNHADRVSEDTLALARADVRCLAPEAALALARLAPASVRRLDEEGGGPPEALAGRRVGAFAGLADPSAFGEDLRRLGARVVFARRLGDHHRYRAGELAMLANEAAAAGADVLVTTEKDAAKLDVAGSREAAIPVRVLASEIRLVEGETALWEAIEDAIEARIGSPPA